MRLTSFTLLAEAERKVHGVTADEVVFHEVVRHANVCMVFGKGSSAIQW